MSRSLADARAQGDTAVQAYRVAHMHLLNALWKLHSLWAGTVDEAIFARRLLDFRVAREHMQAALAVESTAYRAEYPGRGHWWDAAPPEVTTPTC